MTLRPGSGQGGVPPRGDDAAAREAIANDLDDTLIVEAAAGTGKTTELVNRILRVLATGRATTPSASVWKTRWRPSKKRTSTRFTDSAPSCCASVPSKPKSIRCSR